MLTASGAMEATVSHERYGDAAVDRARLPRVDAPRDRLLLPGLAATAVLLAGLLAVILPTLVLIGRETWSTEQGAHGPIVLFTGLWLLTRVWPAARAVAARPPAWRAALLVAPLLVLYAVARVTQIIELEGFLMHGVVIAVAYALIGGASIGRLALPLMYLAFMFPPPETVIYALTMPMKVAISEGAVGLLSAFGYPIGSTGVSIQVGQYQLLVAAACSGLNSIVSLSALSFFYIYVRRAGHWAYAALLLAFVVPVAVIANFVRVLILILLTYHGGEALAQGFLHDFAGFTIFAIALLLMFAIDTLLLPLGLRLERRLAAARRDRSTTSHA